MGSALENDFLILEALEIAFNKRMNERGKEVWANVEFYKGVVYEALGIPCGLISRQVLQWPA